MLKWLLRNGGAYTKSTEQGRKVKSGHVGTHGLEVEVHMPSSAQKEIRND